MNEYRVTISFGDGNPTTTTIKAKSGSEAQDVAFRIHPAARTVHVLGFVSTPPKETRPCLFDSKNRGPTRPPVSPRKRKLIPVLLNTEKVNPLLVKAAKMRNEGQTQQHIADTLGVSRGVVRRLLNAAVRIATTDND